MSFLDAFKKGIDTVKKELNKPESFKKGEKFEAFAKNKVYPDNLFKLLYETPEHDKTSERFNQSAQNPDFKFMDLKTKEEFWVECKYRSKTNDKNQIEAVKPFQLKRHQNLKEPVYYLIGFEGEPSNPKEIFEIPIEEMYTSVYLSHARKFKLIKI